MTEVVYMLVKTITITAVLGNIRKYTLTYTAVDPRTARTWLKLRSCRFSFEASLTLFNLVHSPRFSGTEQVLLGVRVLHSLLIVIELHRKRSVDHHRSHCQ